MSNHGLGWKTGPYNEKWSMDFSTMSWACSPSVEQNKLTTSWVIKCLCTITVPRGREKTMWLCLQNAGCFVIMRCLADNVCLAMFKYMYLLVTNKWIQRVQRCPTNCFYSCFQLRISYVWTEISCFGYVTRSEQSTLSHLKWIHCAYITILHKHILRITGS